MKKPTVSTASKSQVTVKPQLSKAVSTPPVLAKSKSLTESAAQAPLSKPSMPASKAIASAKPAKTVIEEQQTLQKKASDPVALALDKSPKLKLESKTVGQAAVKNKKAVAPKKIKLVRDSFTIPKPEYQVLDVLKQRAIEQKYPIKKAELLRAGIKALERMDDAAFIEAIKAVPNLKTGRPGK